MMFLILYQNCSSHHVHLGYVSHPRNNIRFLDLTTSECVLCFTLILYALPQSLPYIQGAERSTVSADQN
jgi:hypothetical protein